MAIPLFTKLISLFLIMLAGYIVVRIKLLKAEDSRILSIICLYLLCPCSLISAFQIESTPEIKAGLLLGLIAAAIIHAVQIGFSELLKRPLRLNPVEQCSVIYTNAGNLIIPIVSSILGPEWVIYTCAYICVQIPLHWSHCRRVICNEKNLSFKKIISNINIITIILGLIIFAFEIKLPPLVSTTMDSMGSSLGAMSMLAIGMLIGGMKLKDVFLRGRTWFVAGLRLVFFPLLSMLGLRLLASQLSLPDVDKVLLITLLAASAPTAATVTQMAQVYGGREEEACAINVMCNILCVITMPIMIALYQL